MNMNDRSPLLRANIRYLFVLSALGNIGFSVPIVILFQESIGLSLEEAFLIQAFFAISLVIFEIPSGYLSDRWGRKRTTVTGSAALFVGMLFYCFGGGFTSFLLAEIFLALGISFHSGTLEAITYESLAELKEEDRYRKVNGHMGFISLSSRAIMSLIVGFIAAVNLRTPFWADLSVLAIVVIASLLLTEPARKKMQEETHLTAIWNICTHALIRSTVLRSLILLYTVVAAINLMLFWFLQPFQEMVKMPLSAFGLVNALIYLGSALASKYTYLAKRWIGDRAFLFLLAIIAVGSCFVLGFMTTIIGVTFFFLGETTFNAFETLTSDLMNRALTSDIRATVLSLRSFTSRLFFALISPMLGAAADLYSVNTALLITGILGLVTLALTAVMLRPAWRKMT
ncbi:MAG: MFS transporter [Candidatus Peregrinibacteria bacterium]